MTLKKFATFAMLAGAVFALAMPVVTHAQATTFSVQSIGSKVGLNNADLRTAVINTLQIILGLLALVAVVMIVIGGFTWLTAGGNEEKVDKAKKIISAAVIGLIIVLLAWAIVIFVARTTAEATKNS